MAGGAAAPRKAEEEHEAPAPRGRLPTSSIGRAVCAALLAGVLLLAVVALQLSRAVHAPPPRLPAARPALAASAAPLRAPTAGPPTTSRGSAAALAAEKQQQRQQRQQQRQQRPSSARAANTTARARAARGEDGADERRGVSSPELRELEATSIGRAELGLFRSMCACTRREWEALAASPALSAAASVLVIDVTKPAWNGLGNSADRWLNLLRLGHTLGRLTFLRMDPCTPPFPTPAPRHGSLPPLRDPKECRFDLGSHFEALGGHSWRWDEAAAQRVRAALGGAAGGGVAHLAYKCDKVTYACLRGSLLNGSSGGLVGALDEGTGALVDAVERALRGARVGVLEILNEQTAFQLDMNAQPFLRRSRLYGAGGCANTACERFAMTRPRASLASALLPYARQLSAFDAVMALHVRSGYADWQRHEERRAAQHAPAYTPPSHGAHWAQFERLLLDCHELGYPVQSEWPPKQPQGPPQPGEAAAGGPPFCFRYKMGPPPFITRRSPGAVDAARCATVGRHVGDELVVLPSALGAAKALMAALPAGGGPEGAAAREPDAARGPLSAVVACASLWGRRAVAPLSHAQRHALSMDELLPPKHRPQHADGGARARADADAVAARFAANGSLDARWALLVLGDAPALHALLLAEPTLRGRVVSTQAGGAGAGALGHTVFSSACASGRADAGGEGGGKACAQGADPRGAWTRSIVDMYLGGWAKGIVRLLFSSYPGAVAMRSMAQRGAVAWYADYDKISSHRDRRMNNGTVLRLLGTTSWAGEARARAP